MRIYLDTCSLHRPLDSRSQIRIALEAEAILGVIALCEAGKVERVSSEVLLFETGRNPRPERREYALNALSKAKSFIGLNDEIETRARVFNVRGVKPLDALHLASAEAAQVDYFCTSDDKFLKRAKAMTDLTVKVVLPTELIEEIEP